MSLRIMLCLVMVIGFSIYAWRNWFVSLCASILLMAFLEHPDMPHSLLGIQGLNPWNLLLFNVMLGWWADRRRTGIGWDLPKHITVLLLLYLCVVLWSFSRLVMDFGALSVLNGATYKRVDYTISWITSEYLINSVKWMIPGLLLFDACRTRGRALTGIAVVLGLYVLLALQVVKHMPISYVTASEDTLVNKAAIRLDHDIGYHRVNLSMMLGGASWAVLSTVILAQKFRYKVMLIGLAGLVTLAQALTGGRAGYVSWGLVGLILCILRWRVLLPLIPVTVLGVCLFLPTVRDRMLQGIVTANGKTDAYEVTSGRNIAWSYVIPKIEANPIFGYGRQAMIRQGIYQRILAEHGEAEAFPHPHNAYLELLLDDGLIGFLLVMPFYFVMLHHSFRLLLDRSDPLLSATGGVACSLILALMIASMGAQSFYPTEGAMGMWGAIGLALRVYRERQLARETGRGLFAEEEETSGEAVLEEEPAPQYAAGWVG